MKILHAKRRRLRSKSYRAYLASRRYSRGSVYPKSQWVYESVPLFQRTFKEWLHEANSSIGAPLEIAGRFRRYINLSFIGYPSCISVSVRPSEISVWVEWQGEYVDMLLDLDLSIPVRSNGTIFCEMCLPEHVVHYFTLTDYWRGHQFERFAQWVNERLLPARWLVIYRNYARLHADRPDSDSDLLALIELPTPDRPDPLRGEEQSGEREKECGT